MTHEVYLPPDEFQSADRRNVDLAADYLELNAVFSQDSQSFSRDIVAALELSGPRSFPDAVGNSEARHDVAIDAVNRMASRRRALERSYPFELDKRGDVVRFTAEIPDLGQTAYLVSLLLSNLPSLSPLLVDSQMNPSTRDVRQLRRFFQYFATAAVAAEIGGPAWSFGFPRPDGSGFLDKLSEIWGDLRDGVVEPASSAPRSPKDDKVDIFAWRQQTDGLPGFLLVAAQVATGSDWKDKSIKSHIDGVFQDRWFSPTPATKMVPYHVIPFARPDIDFRDDVLTLGNVLHRLRVPRRVFEAVGLVEKGVAIEAFEKLAKARDWIQSYLGKARKV